MRAYLMGAGTLLYLIKRVPENSICHDPFTRGAAASYLAFFAAAGLAFKQKIHSYR